MVNEARDPAQPGKRRGGRALQEHASVTDATGPGSSVEREQSHTAGDASEQTSPPVPPAMRRAEELTESALLWAAAFGSVVAKRLRKVVALAREELEDMIAEAEHVRHQWQQGQRPPVDR